VANFLQKLEIFRAWGWKDMMALSQSVQVLRFRRGDVIFHQGAKVAGIYAVRRGAVNIIHLRNAKESELRFPGREDLVMEEDLELKTYQVVHRSLLGACDPDAIFGEEPAGYETKEHRFQVEAAIATEAFFIPWELWQEEASRRSAAVTGTLALLARNDLNRASWVRKRAKHLRALEFLVEVNKYRHVNESAYLRAATAIDRLMNLEAAILPKEQKGVTGQQAQYCDVEAAEAAMRKALENLQFIYRGARNPAQANEIRRAMGSMEVELNAMVGRIRGAFQEQQRERIM
ncbi:hypothetical protein T484DRAFT_1970998, partial [Baffinella frigidus]